MSAQAARKKEAQQTTADIVHAAFRCFCGRKVVNLKIVDLINFSYKFAARNHISGTLGTIIAYCNIKH